MSNSASLRLSCLPSAQIYAGEYRVNVYYPIPKEIMNLIGKCSLAANCPMKDSHLAYLRLTHKNMQLKSQTGDVIVNVELISRIGNIFQKLWDGNFPICQMRLIDNYSANDEASMADNNSSFLCQRAKTGQSINLFENWSRHSFGVAGDINPLFNPYIKGDVVLPFKARSYADRSMSHLGMIHEGDVCHEAFVFNDFIWGGGWNSLKDYQHFEVSQDFFQDLKEIWKDS